MRWSCAFCVLALLSAQTLGTVRGIVHDPQHRPHHTIGCSTCQRKRPGNRIPALAVHSVAKVCSEVSRQVIDSARSVYAVLCVAFVITYATCQELYFPPLTPLEGYSARHLKNRC